MVHILDSDTCFCSHYILRRCTKRRGCIAGLSSVQEHVVRVAWMGNVGMASWGDIYERMFYCISAWIFFV